MTSDTEAARSFYAEVIGWDIRDSGMPDMSYSILYAGPDMVGGMMPIPEEAYAMGARPGWLGYIGVDDVDACAAQITELGGKIHRAPEDIPEIGRFAVVADLHGAPFVLFRPMGEATDTRMQPGKAGHVGWHELHAGDGPQAFGFYSTLFGWRRGEALDMGPMGVYQLFETRGAAIGAMMTKTAEIPMPFWLFYFNVDGLDAAIERAGHSGGQVIMGPHEVPGGSWIAHCLDPQGAIFAMVAAQR
nr:VOC family protein [Pseudomonas sp.]